MTLSIEELPPAQLLSIDRLQHGVYMLGGGRIEPLRAAVVAGRDLQIGRHR